MTSNRIHELVEQLSRAFDDNDTLIARCQDIALEVESGRGKVYAVVQELGPYLTSTDVAVRSNGVKSLSLILERLRDDYLDETELQLLADFYCNRLEDHHSIGPATIFGILAIVRMKALPQAAPARLVHGIFQHIRCQSELQETRRHIYTIFQILLEYRLDDLRSMGPDFVYGVIASIDGESDPRNLMLLFNFLPMFMKEFPMGHLIEEMFEVVACYFPIDFNASSLIDKRRITREDLADALAPCLYAIPEFAQFCLPHVMEKLDSDRKIAKLDSLSLLCKAVTFFGSKGLKQHLNELWPLLRKEAMSVSDQEIKKLSLETINRIVKALSDDEENRRSFVEKIFTDTRWSLCDVQLSLYWPAEKILEAVARTDEKSCSQVLLEVVPLCLGQYSTKTSNTDKLTLMETLNNFVRICSEFGFTIGDIPELAWTDVPGLYLNVLDTRDNTLRAKALAGLVIQKSSLKEGQRVAVYEKVCDIVDSEISGDVRNTCHSALYAFSKLYPDEMLGVLQRRMSINIDTITDTSVLTRRLEAISLLTKIRVIGTATLPLILETAMSKRPEIDATALRCLYRVLASPNADFDVHRYLYEHCDAIARLIRCDEDCAKKLSLVSSVTRSIVRKLSAEDQRKIIETYVVAVVEAGADVKITGRDVLLYEGILTPLRLDVAIPNVEKLISLLYDLITKLEDPEIIRSACRIIAVLVNKMYDDSDLEKITNQLRARIVEILRTNEISLRHKRSAIILHTWLTKALVTRGSRNSQEFLDYQINILRLDSVGSCVSEEFKTLVERTENSLTEENYSRIKIFYKQRIFQNVIESRSGFEGASRQNYLVTLAHLVEEVPVELPFMQLQALVPLLVESLSLDDGQLLLSTLRTLKLLLEAKHEIFLDQIQCFIPKCLQLATYKKMDVRIAALDCLLSYCEYPVTELLKYKDEVLEKLAEPLDDPKRLVRRVAVRASTRWYLVGAPGTSDK